MLEVPKASGERHGQPFLAQRSLEFLGQCNVVLSIRCLAATIFRLGVFPVEVHAYQGEWEYV